MSDSRLVVLKVDETPAEDRTYVIGVIEVPLRSWSDFPKYVEGLRDNLRARAEENGDGYQDQDLIEELDRRGFRAHIYEEIILS